MKDSESRKADMDKRPNIIIINPDQMRADSLFHLGNPASHTPTLDRLAEDGASFAKAFCQNPVCTPSRCSFMSGWYPHVAGHRTMNHMMHSHEPVLLKRLKNHGYNVWMNQRNDLLPAQNANYYKDYCTTYFKLKEPPRKLPEDNWRGEMGGDNFYSFYRGEIPEGKDIDDIWTDAVVDYIEHYDEDKPFCVFLPLMLPHPTYQVSEPYYSMIDRKKLPKRINPPKDYKGKPKMEKGLADRQGLKNWKESDFDELRATYLGMCAKVDDLTKQVVEALKNKGIYDNTAIFVFSDHGDFTGDYGIVEKAQNCFEDCLTNVPLVVKLPKNQQKVHGRIDELVELIDFYATVEDIAELGNEHTHFGNSLVGLLKGDSNTGREYVFSEGGFRKGEDHCKETGGQTIPNPKGLYYPRQSLQASDDMYNGKGVMCRSKKYKYIRRLYEQDEFYDLEKDPKELKNEINNPIYKDQITEMKEVLLEFYQDTCDVVPYEKDSRMDKDMIQLIM